MATSDVSEKKAPPGVYALGLQGCAFAVMLPLALSILTAAIVALTLVVQILLGRSANHNLLGLLLIIFCGLVVAFALSREARRLYLIYQRERGIRQEQQRTSNLMERDTSRLETDEAEMNVGMLPEQEQHQRRS